MIGRNDRDRDVSSGKFKRHVFFRFKASDFNISRIYTSPRVYLFFFFICDSKQSRPREERKEWMWRSGSFEGRSILHLDPLLPNFFNQIDSCVYLFHKLIEACFSIQSIFHKKLIVWKDVVSISLSRKLYSTSLFIRNSKVSSHFLIVLMVKEDFFALLWERSRVL